MPVGFTKVPHYKQSKDGACLPACVRMVLATFGDKRDEAELANIMGGYEFGTPARFVTRIERLGYKVDYRQFELLELSHYLSQELYPIVFVYAGFLDWADFEGFHALVITKITATTIFLLDPTLDDGPTPISYNGFLMAWMEFDNLAAIISR